jgi:uncharacterized membrane protein YeiH
MEQFLLVLDVLGAFIFALSGATAGVRRRLDLFGVLVLSFAAANAGGITRDLLIGAIPPSAIQDWRYVAVSVVAGMITFSWYQGIDKLRSPVLVFDGAGLALFAVTGTQKALAFGLNPVAAVLLGMLTGIGGGMARDMLLAEIPTVLRAELYAFGISPPALVAKRSASGKRSATSSRRSITYPPRRLRARAKATKQRRASATRSASGRASAPLPNNGLRWARTCRRAGVRKSNFSMAWSCVRARRSV